MPKAKVRYVGLDVHKDSIVIAVAEQGRHASREVGAFSSDWASLEKQLKRLAMGYTLKLCYEAGPTGFELHRRLVQAGYDNQVIAPSLIPRKPGERIKTDRRDAAKLAHCLRAGDLTAIYVPDQDTEALRDLERARDAAKKSETSSKHQLSKFLLRQGRRWDGASNWTAKHFEWIRRQSFEHEAHKPAYIRLIHRRSVARHQPPITTPCKLPTPHLTGPAISGCCRGTRRTTTCEKIWCGLEARRHPTLRTFKK